MNKREIKILNTIVKLTLNGKNPCYCKSNLGFREYCYSSKVCGIGSEDKKIIEGMKQQKYYVLCKTCKLLHERKKK